MLRRSLVALAVGKAGNTSENLLNEILQIIYSLYCATEITKKVYKNTINSIMDNTKWILYLWIPEVVKHLIFLDYYSMFWIKWIKKEGINMSLYRILVSTKHGKK